MTVRKVPGFVLAAALVVPIGLVPSPGGTATASPTCKTLSGTQTFSPALPMIGNKAVVTSKVTTAAKLSGCTGGGVSGATSASTSHYVGNCTTLIKTAAIKGTSTIKWSSGKTSTVATTLTTTSKLGAIPVLKRLVSKFTGGLFLGTTSSVNLKVTAPVGACVKTGLTKITFVNTGPFTDK